MHSDLWGPRRQRLETLVLRYLSLPLGTQYLLVDTVCIITPSLLYLCQIGCSEACISAWTRVSVRYEISTCLRTCLHS